MGVDRDSRFVQLAKEHGIDFEHELHAGAHYDIAVVHRGEISVSGQIPKVRNEIRVEGRVGEETSLDEGKQAARICALRVLAVLRQTLGSLDKIDRLLRVNVYVQSAPDFTQQSEVADAASRVFYSIFEPDGGHARTAVGVYQLPKNASVAVDLTAAIIE